jgi:hypothetical protein
MAVRWPVVGRARGVWCVCGVCEVRFLESQLRVSNFVRGFPCWKNITPRHKKQLSQSEHLNQQLGLMKCSTLVVAAWYAPPLKRVSLPNKAACGIKNHYFCCFWWGQRVTANPVTSYFHATHSRTDNARKRSARGACIREYVREIRSDTRA